MRHLSVPEILGLHAEVIARDGGAEGLRSQSSLEAVAALQGQEVFGKAVYETIFLKAAALSRGIIGNHAFVDGNKRTAMLCAIVFLQLNGLLFTAKPREIADFAVDIAVRQLSVEEIATWYEIRCLQKECER